MFGPARFFDLQYTAHARLFEGCQSVWDALKKLRDYCRGVAAPSGKFTLVGKPYIGEGVVIGEGTVIEEGAMILGPAVIGCHCHIRHGAYIRDHSLLGDRVVVGNACEVKASILFDDCQVPHFNYVGDSILGHRVHLGAGAKISNVKLMPGNIEVSLNEQRVDTGLEKFGAILGDGAQVGCNAVLNPGSILGAGSIVYPCLNWRGILPAHFIAKQNGIFNIK